MPRAAGSIPCACLVDRGASCRAKLAVVLTLIISVIYLAFSGMPSSPDMQSSIQPPQATAMDCDLVYIDLGTNVGIQLRKLYEPHLYPSSKIRPYFEKYFGNRSKSVCSFGFEPNPAHGSFLRTLESAYRKKGIRITIHQKAVDLKAGVFPFKRQPEDQKFNEWGARLAREDESDTVPVEVISFADWYADVIMSHTRLRPVVVMKVDIEGRDMAVISSLVLKGLFCSFDFIYAEHVTPAFINATKLLQSNYPNCPTLFIRLDDESYHSSQFPLPT